MQSKPRILVVDDEPQITRVLLRSLTSKGYEVRIAGDGDFALQTFHDWPPSLVITDLNAQYGRPGAVPATAKDFRSAHHRLVGTR